MKAIMPAYPIDLCDTRKEAAAAQAHELIREAKTDSTTPPRQRDCAATSFRLSNTDRCSPALTKVSASGSRTIVPGLGTIVPELAFANSFQQCNSLKSLTDLQFRRLASRMPLVS